jgi:hypothetical protein
MTNRRPGPARVLVGVGALWFAVGASSAVAATPPPLDTVTVTGSTANGLVTNIDISGQSEPGGQNTSGNVFFTNGNFNSFGPLLCLNVTGPDRGGGTATAPTVAYFNYQENGLGLGVASGQIVDNGGSGADMLFITLLNRAPTDCSPFTPPPGASQPLNGRAVVFDAPVLPASKDQCKNGGWRDFPQFKNQGDCVAFVEHHRQTP